VWSAFDTERSFRRSVQPVRPTRPFLSVGSVEVVDRANRRKRGDRAISPIRTAHVHPSLESPDESVHPSRPRIEVQILGPVQILGAPRPIQRAWTLELIVYLAMHPRGARNDVWATALWPEFEVAASTIHSTVSAARRTVGRGSDGNHLLRRDHGLLRLSAEVDTDWKQFCELAAAPDPSSWHRALSLVRGRPFEDLRRSDWTVLEGIAASVEEAVVHLALLVAEHDLSLGDGRQAAADARRGLLASPYDERLYRILLKAADQEGNPAGVESAMAELACLLGGPVLPHEAARSGIHPEQYVHPATYDLYRALSRRSRAVPNGGDSTQ